MSRIIAEILSSILIFNFTATEIAASEHFTTIFVGKFYYSVGVLLVVLPRSGQVQPTGSYAFAQLFVSLGLYLHAKCSV